MYGHEFKKLRLEQGITQKEACSGICSESKLSRWEMIKSRLNLVRQ